MKRPAASFNMNERGSSAPSDAARTAFSNCPRSRARSPGRAAGSPLLPGGHLPGEQRPPPSWKGLSPPICRAFLGGPIPCHPDVVEAACGEAEAGACRGRSGPAVAVGCGPIAAGRAGVALTGSPSSKKPTIDLRPAALAKTKRWSPWHSSSGPQWHSKSLPVSSLMYSSKPVSLTCVLYLLMASALVHDELTRKGLPHLDGLAPLPPRPM